MKPIHLMLALALLSPAAASFAQADAKTAGGLLGLKRTKITPVPTNGRPREAVANHEVIAARAGRPSGRTSL